MSDFLLIKIAPPPKYEALFLKVAFIKKKSHLIFCSLAPKEHIYKILSLYMQRCPYLERQNIFCPVCRSYIFASTEIRKYTTKAILTCPCLTIINTGSSCHNANCALIMQEDELIHVSDNESVIGDGDLMNSAFAPNSSRGTEQPSCSASSASFSGVGLIDRLKEMFPDVENSILTSVAEVSSSLDEAVEEILGAQTAQRSAYQVDVKIQETEGEMGSYIEIQYCVRSLSTPM